MTTQTQTRQPFISPYPGIRKDPEGSKCITVGIDRGDYNAVASIRPGSGTITTTIGLLWHKLCVALRESSITEYGQSHEFEQFILNLRLVDGRGLCDRPADRPVTVSHAPDDRATTPLEGAGNTTASPVVPNLQSPGRGRRKGKETGVSSASGSNAV